jgi:hypothetical protein
MTSGTMSCCLFKTLLSAVALRANAKICVGIRMFLCVSELNILRGCSVMVKIPQQRRERTCNPSFCKGTATENALMRPENL